MATKLPPPPVREPITNKEGIMSPIWWTWFQQCFNRIGGTVASSPSEQDELAAFYDLPIDRGIASEVLEAISIFEGSSDAGSLRAEIEALKTIVLSLQDAPRQSQPQADPDFADNAHRHPINAVAGLQNILDEMGAQILDQRSFKTLGYAGTSKITVGTTAPDNPLVGDLWVDTN